MTIAQAARLEAGARLRQRHLTPSYNGSRFGTVQFTAGNLLAIKWDDGPATNVPYDRNNHRQMQVLSLVYPDKTPTQRTPRP